jgi:hypothetical protein
MKNCNIILLAVLSIFSFASCEKVIDIKLDDAEPRLVISGAISDVDSIPIIKITETISYNQPNNFPEIQDATVIVRDDLGTIDTFVARSTAGYRGVTLGAPGRTYSLSILYDAQEYNATVKMPQPVNIDSVTIEAINTPGGEFPLLSTYFQDPPGEKNYYYLNYLINGEDSGDFSFLSDDLRDGEEIVVGTISDDYEGVGPGDTITVQLQSIDASMYEYYRTREALEDGGGSGLGSSTPDNPTSNITNRALGYFNVYSQTEKDFIL